MTARRSHRLHPLRSDGAQEFPDRIAKLRDKLVLTPTEYAALSGRSRSWVEERCRDGTIPSLSVGSRRILKAAELRANGWL